MNHPANSGTLRELKLKCILELFWFHFGRRLQRYIQQIQKDKPLKSFGNPESVSQSELRGKKRDRIIVTLPMTSRDLSNFGKHPPFSGNSGWECQLSVSKNFLRGYPLYLLNIVAIAVPKWEEKISKIFNFSYCKQPELAGRFILFNTKRREVLIVRINAKHFSTWMFALREPENCYDGGNQTLDLGGGSPHRCATQLVGWPWIFQTLGLAAACN